MDHLYVHQILQKISINSGLNSLIFLRTNSYAFRYSSEVVPAGKGILKILLYLPFSFSAPVPG